MVLWCNLFPVPHASRHGFVTLLNCLNNDWLFLTALWGFPGIKLFLMNQIVTFIINVKYEPPFTELCFISSMALQYVEWKMLHFWVEEKLSVCIKLLSPVLSNTKTQYTNRFFINTCQKIAVKWNKKYIKQIQIQ